ncbi:MAG: four helix bundle protein [Candidatus Brocadiales bacterium]|nr:four helix bundle protein [Candidatus Brocadiales bacterium]
MQFCKSRGSRYELIDHIDVAEECLYIDRNQADSLIEEIKTTIRILNGYIKYLKARKGGIQPFTCPVECVTIPSGTI